MPSHTLVSRNIAARIYPSTNPSMELFLKIQSNPIHDPNVKCPSRVQSASTMKYEDRKYPEDFFEASTRVGADGRVECEV